MILPLNNKTEEDIMLQKKLYELNIKYNKVCAMLDEICNYNTSNTSNSLTNDGLFNASLADEVLIGMFLNKFALLLQNYLNDLDDDELELNDKARAKLNKTLLEMLGIRKEDQNED